MTPACDTCQLDFRPGEEADMETWERDGVARCRPCAREFAQLRRFVDANDAFSAIDDFWRSLDDALASPLAAEIDARGAHYPPSGGNVVMITGTPSPTESPFTRAWMHALHPTSQSLTLHSRSRPHG